MLKIIGAGFSRTGTSSLKQALEVLGFAPCYHMHEVFSEPEHVRIWANALAKTPNWQKLFKGYTSAVDAPTCHFWRQVHSAFKGSKVILTERDPDEWYESFYATIFRVLSEPSSTPPSELAAVEMVRELELERVFSNRFEDKAHATNIYLQHNQNVKDTMPAENLLVFNVSSGWKPLCEFLEVELPEADFPHSNSQAQF